MLILNQVLLEALKQVLIMTRHGTRTPMVGFPNDDSEWQCLQRHLYNFQHKNNPLSSKPALKLVFDVKNNLKGPCFSGQLADQGYQQNVFLSQLWEQLYESVYSNSSIRTTSIERVRLSLSGQLNNVNASIHNAHVANMFTDSTAVNWNCSWISTYKKYLYEHSTYHRQELSALQHRCQLYDNWEGIGDDMKARIAMNVPFPSCLTLQEVNLAMQIQDDQFNLRYFTNPNINQRTKFIQITIGTYMNDLINLIQNGTPFHISSAHDTSVGPLAAVLIQGEFGQVGFSSFINVEVWEENGKELVKVRFRNGPKGEGKYMVQNACGEVVCTKQQVIYWLEKYRISVKQREEMCRSQFVE
ncbi:Acid_phosphatase [Hexamita inflata]|uniref:Acid phosphatase n=1 Tax=Hexamita inflata TaxID=28002 RepID=A0AA86NTG8_9EUKA|nr:Acid phosphatase [Hexamita inflata]